MATETLIDPRNLERSRLAVAPEITESRLDDERERDLHAARVLRDARNAAKQGLTVPGLRKELEAYREHRRKRGEQPFQYLKQAIQAEKGKTEVEKIRAFAPLFAGADKIAEAYPPEQRQSFLDHFIVSANPQAAMMQAANLQWVEHATGIPRRDLAEAWPAHRARYAKALGHEGPIDDAGLYGLIGSRLNQQVQFLDSSEKAARAARAAAVQGRSLADALAEARQAAGPEYEKAARQAYADLMARFTDDEIRVANDIFLMQSQVEGADTRQEGETTQGNFFAEYGRMTAEQRIRVLGLVAEQAENQGEQIEGFFNRMGRAFRSGADRFGRSVEAVANAGVPEVINDILKAGRVPKDFDVEFPGRSWEAITVPNENVTEFRPLTDDERKQLAEQRDIAAGMTALNRDLMSQVPAIRQFIRQESEGFWAGVANASAMAMESLPVMLAAPIAPLSVNFYYQDARGRLDLEAPEASAAAKDRIALATGLISAGIDRLQIGLTFSKLTRANAWLLQQGIPGKLASMGLRAVTVGAAEFGQEIAQDLTLPVLQDFAAALNNDIPHVDWESEMKRLHDSLGDLAAVSLLFGVVGGVGQGVTNYIQRDRVKAALTDRNGLAAFGIDETRAEEIATVAETNPDAAAELLKAATRDIPAEERKANAEAAVERQRREAETVEALRAAGLPGPIVRNAEGKAQFEYQGETRVFDTPEQALEAIRAIDKDQSVELAQLNRQLLSELQEAAPENVTVEATEGGQRRTLAEWAGDNAQRIEQARERVRIYLRQAGNDMGINVPAEDIDLSRWFIQGSSRNVYAGELSTIAIELSESATPATVVEEYAEGISKFMRDRAGVAEEKQVGWIRQTEAGTGRRFLQDDLSALSPELRQQAIDEAFSSIAVGYAFGRVTDEQAPSAIRAFLRAFKEFLSDVLALARDIRLFRQSGQMDAEFRRWLDVATGMDLSGEIEQARIAADADMARQIEEAMTGEGRTFAITPAQDAEYLAAVERGDMATAQRMVDEAAKAAGYDIGPVFHGTGSRFDRFSFDHAGKVTEADSAKIAFFFTDGRRTAESYARKAAVFSEDAEIASLLKQMERANKVGDWDKAEALMAKIEELEFGEGADERRQALEEENAQIYEVYLKGNFKTLDAEGNNYLSLRNASDFKQYGGKLTKALEQAKIEGFEGVKIENFDDAINATETATHWAVFSPNQIKSADPVTRDEAGNIVPLSQRFNPEDERITFSITPAQDAEYLAAVEAGDTAKAEELFMDAALANPPEIPNDLREAWEIGRKVAGMSDTEAVYSGLVPDWVFNFGHEVTEFYEAGRREETPEFVVGWRRGDLPEGGRSRNYASNEAEPGVSIAYAHRRDDMELNAITMMGVGGRKKVFVEGWAFPKSRWGSDGEIVILNAKEIEPIKKDDSGNVIPLSQRFPSSGQTFAITPATGPLEQAIARMPRNPEDKARVYEKMRDLVADVKSRRSFGRFTDDNARRFAQIRDIALLEAMAKALPREVRGVLIPAFRQVSELTNAEKRAGYIESLLPKIEQALERQIAKNYREAIRKLMKRGLPKTSEARTRGSSTTAETAAIFEQAREAMRLTDDPATSAEGKTAAKKAEEMAEALREKQNDPTLSDERLAELEGRIAALELFGDYRNADSKRLSEGFALLSGVYAEGRAERLEVLKARRDWRNAAVETILKGLGVEGEVTDAQRNAARRKAEGILRRVDDAIMEMGLSGSQMVRRLGELTDDARVQTLLDEMEMAFLDAELAEKDANESDSKALQDAMRRIFGAKSAYAVSKRLRDLTAPEIAPVERVVGRRVEEVKVPIAQIEAYLEGDLDALAAGGVAIDPVWETLSDQDAAQLEAEWELWNMLPESERARKRVLSFDRLVSEGERQTVGEINQLEGLQLWLTMRQPDQAEKLLRLGYDDQTMVQLEAWLRPETKALGLWMVDHIGADAFNVDNIHRAEKGVGLRLVENYFPVRNDVAGADTSELSIEGKQIHGGKSIGSLKERVSNNAPPAYVNAVAVFLANRAEVNFWKSHVSTLRQWGGLIGDERVAGAVKVALGESYYLALRRMLKRIENGGRMNAAGLMKWEKAMRSLMSNFAVGTLGLRASTLAINTTAALNFTMEIPAKDIARGIANVAKRPEAFADAFKSPAVQRRLSQGATFEAQQAKSLGISDRPTVAQLRKAAEAGVMPINWVDTGTNTLGAAIAYENARLDALESGMTEEQAKTEGNRAVERLFLRAAQPTTRFGKSEIEARALENPGTALFMLFTSEPRQKLAIAYMAARQLVTGKGTYRSRKEAAQAVFAAFVIMQTAAYFVRSAISAFTRAKEEEEGNALARFVDRLSDWRAWAYGMTTEHLSAVPVAGAVWDSVMANVFDQPVFDKNANIVLQTGNKAYREAAKLFDDEKELTIEQSIESGIRLVQSLGSMIPGGAVFAQGGNVADFVYASASSNEMLISEEDRVRRYKARFNAFKRELTEDLGPTAVEGKIDKDIQAKKWGAYVEWLQSRLQGLSPELRSAILESIEAPASAKEKVKAQP